MIHKRQGNFVVTLKLQPTWPPVGRWAVGVHKWAVRQPRRAVDGLRRVDVRKPVHAATIGVLLAGVLAPVLGELALNERYRMDVAERAVIESPSPKLMEKLKYSKEKQANIFNESDDPVGAPPSGDTTVMQAGGGKKQLYTAVMPDDASKGITITDNMNKVTIGFKPQVNLLGGRGKNGQVIYPLKDQPGQMVFTPKGNGVKEDIYLERAPKDDVAEYDYQLDLPEYIEPRINTDGSVGFYTADQQLFGNISYGTKQDEALVNKARQNQQKKYEMFRIPAPEVRQTGKGEPVRARFHLDGKTLGVFVEGLSKAGYPLSIDPTFLLQSTSDFVLGSVDDNIDLSQANQIGRFPLSGGSVAGWNTDTALSSGNYDGALVAYNSALYMIGGGNQDGTTGNVSTTMVRYILLNSNGTESGSWTTTSSLNLARMGLVGFGFNGYLYAVGGEDSGNSGNVIGNCTSGTYSGQNCTVEYAQIQSNGSVGSWAPTTGLATAVAYPAGAEYQGVIYVMGGGTGVGGVSGLVTTVQSARIAANGTIGSWTTSASSPANNDLPTATSKAAGGAYNGFLYAVGGYTAAGGGTVVSTVAYAPINSDGTVGAWSTSTAFPTARRGHGFAVINGYMYVYGGCSSATLPCPSGNFLQDTHYASINVDGTIGQWQQTQDYSASGAARSGIMSAFYNGFLHFVGGCHNDVGSGNIKCTNPGLSAGNVKVYSGFDVVGRYDRGVQGLQTTRPYNNNAATVARAGAKAVAMNGYIYLIGGCSTTSCNTATSYSSVVEYTQIQANGTLGTISTTSALNAQTGNNAGRFGHSVVAYNNKIYVVGGLERTTGNADSYQATVISASQNTNGTLNAWGTEANSLPVAKAFATAEVWHDRIFVMGGLSNASTVVATIYKSQISSNAPGSWSATTSSLNNARWGHSGGIWGNWIYVVGGQTTAPGGAGTYVSTANATEQLTITNAGDITTVTTRNVSGAFSTRLMGGFVQNGVLYTFGGYTSGSTSSVATINWSQLDASTGVPGTWSATNIGNNAATYGLATARGHTTAVSANGMFYVMGGCSATLVATSFSACGTFVTTTNTTEANLTNNGGTGQTGSFASATALPNTANAVAGRADHMQIAYNGYLYVLGGCDSYSSGVCANGRNLSDIQAAAIARDGTLGSWTTTGMTALPAAASLGGAVAYSGYMYVVQGLANGTPNAASNKVWRAPISSTGTIGTWVDNSALYLPVSRYNFGIAMSGAYIYVAGGYDGTSRKADLYYTHVNTSQGGAGTIEAPTGTGCSTVWCTAALTSFSTAREGLNLQSYNGKLYVIGGTDGTNTFNDIQVGTASTTDGSISSWSYVTDAGRGMRNRQVVAANGYMYFLGNEGSGTDVQYADINANGTLGSQQLSTGLLAAAHPHGAAAKYNGFIYMTGGCNLSGSTCNTIITSGTSEYAGMKSIARTGHYSKLFTTQVDTAPSQLQINGSLSGPGSVVTMQFYTASSGTPTFGVAQLISPMIFQNFYIVQALDPSGTNVGIALNYLIKLTLDDSASGTFPDTTTSTETYVNNVTLYYHANPGRRMRHGKQFTNTGCNDLNPTAGCLLDTAP